METNSIKANREKKALERIGVQSNVLRKSDFDTKNYYYYFTELRKEQYSK